MVQPKCLRPAAALDVRKLGSQHSLRSWILELEHGVENVHRQGTAPYSAALRRPERAQPFNVRLPNATIADTRDGGLPNPNAGKILSGSGSRVLQARPCNPILSTSRWYNPSQGMIAFDLKDNSSM